MGQWQLIFLIASLLVSTIALAFSAATFYRAGRWKESEDGKELERRLSAAEKWAESPAALALIDLVDEHSRQLAAGEERFENLATKADVARLQAEVSGLEKAVDRVDAGVVRIEKILMEHNR